MTEPVYLDIREVAALHISHSSVGFLDRSSEKPKSLGSGTFIRFGKTSGLLTCAHVAHALEERLRRGEDHVSIVMFPVRKTAIQNTLIKISHLNIVRIGEPPWGETGPDIAFIGLPSSYAGTLEAQASIVNGDVQAERSRSPQPALDAIEIVAGVIDEWIKTELVPGGRNLAKVDVLGTTGTIRSQSDPKGYDLLDFEVGAEQLITMPSSFRGTSGGGIWRLFYKLDSDGKIEIVERRLSGVAFFEKPGWIIGHGPTTIYNHLHKKITDLG